MQTAPRNHGLRPWVVPLVLAGLVLPLIPGASGSALGREAGNAGYGPTALIASPAWQGGPTGPLSPVYSVSATRMERDRDTSIQGAIVSVGPQTVATPRATKSPARSRHCWDNSIPTTKAHCARLCPACAMPIRRVYLRVIRTLLSGLPGG